MFTFFCHKIDSFYIPTRFHEVLGGVLKSEYKVCAMFFIFFFYFFFFLEKRQQRCESRHFFRRL